VGLYQITVKFKLPRRLVLLVTNVFGISPLLVWREMTLEESQISDTHSLKGVVNANLTKMCNKVIFPRTFETVYFLHLKSISGIFRVLTTLESTILENSLFFWQFDFEF
jgi:hypothetical protein